MLWKAHINLCSVFRILHEEPGFNPGPMLDRNCRCLSGETSLFEAEEEGTTFRMTGWALISACGTFVNLVKQLSTEAVESKQKREAL